MNPQQIATSDVNILVVDDAPDNLRLLTALLSEQGYIVRPAVSGTQALAAVREELPDLILLDIKMPQIDGYEVCKQLKADEATHDIPVIFISALGEPQNKAKGFTLGGVDFITKPFQAEEMLSRVKTHFTLYHFHKQLEDKNAQLENANKRLELRNKVAKEQLFYAAAHDPLTGLANRSLFLDHLEQALQRSKRYSDEKFTVLFLELDHFKVVNDSLGHKLGDSLLIEFSRRLQGCLRPVDTAARLGGDEFTILLDRIATVQEAVSVVKRIQTALTVPFQLQPQEVFMTASIGITLGSPSYEYPGDVLRDADTAMYQAKSAGRAQYVIFDKSMHTRATERLRLETELRQAVKRQEFQVYYQPIISLPGGQISGAEVLLRWHHPQHGLIPPMEFIPLAEETGLIIPISEWLIRTVCTQQKAWQRAGYPPIVLSINISTRDLQCPDLVQRVEHILAETEVAPDTIELEITETAVMDNIHSSLETLQDLSHLGIRISIDDFGTGHSSLGRLKHLPIQTLKIDQSFIHDMANNPDDETLTKAIIAIAQSLNLEVIAEGVETDEQLSFLQAQHCDKLQGFLFSRPLPIAEFTRLLEERKHFVICETASHSGGRDHLQEKPYEGTGDRRQNLPGEIL